MRAFSYKSFEISLVFAKTVILIFIMKIINNYIIIWTFKILSNIYSSKINADWDLLLVPNSASSPAEDSQSPFSLKRNVFERNSFLNRTQSLHFYEKCNNSLIHEVISMQKVHHQRIRFKAHSNFFYFLAAMYILINF